MTQQHPTTPSQELVQKWIEEGPPLDQPKFVAYFIADRTAQWSADTELEECCAWLVRDNCTRAAHRLRAARRPKPPSAVAQAEALINCHVDGWCPTPDQWEVIRKGLAEGRRALESIPDD